MAFPEGQTWVTIIEQGICKIPEPLNLFSFASPHYLPEEFTISKWAPLPPGGNNWNCEWGQASRLQLGVTQVNCF